MPGRLTITLPLPPKALSPNARTHWAARPTKAYRLLAKLETINAMNRAEMFNPPGWERASAALHFYFATKRRRDDDNALASFKAGRDGIADSGLLRNDSGLRARVETMAVDKANPRVEIVIEELP